MINIAIKTINILNILTLTFYYMICYTANFISVLFVSLYTKQYKVLKKIRKTFVICFQ